MCVCVCERERERGRGIAFLTEVLSKDGHMKNAVPIIPLAMRKIFMLTFVTGPLVMEGVESLLPSMKCSQKQRCLSIHVPRHDQLQVSIHHQPTHVSLSKGRSQVQRVISLIIPHLFDHIAISNNTHEPLSHVTPVIGDGDV